AHNSVRNFKLIQVAKINKELEENGSRFRVANSYDGSANLVFHRIEEKPPRFENLTYRQHKAIADAVRSYTDVPKSGVRSASATPEVRIQALNVKLAKAGITTVKFAVPPVGSVLPLIIPGDPSFV
ncbi:MAG: hypothetical protein O3A81_01230, partial [bacterium]|nr:hypothetical protein [bacterium]